MGVGARRLIAGGLEDGAPVPRVPRSPLGGGVESPCAEGYLNAPLVWPLGAEVRHSGYNLTVRWFTAWLGALLEVAAWQHVTCDAYQKASAGPSPPS